MSQRDWPLREGIDIPEVTEADKAVGRFHNHVRMCEKTCHIATCGNIPSSRYLCPEGLAYWTTAVRLALEQVGLPVLD